MTQFETPKNNEITYLEADINYTIFHLNGGKKIVSSFTLKKYESDSRLSGFLRVHKSILLNPGYVKSIEKQGKKATVKMADGTVLQVSRRKLYLVNNLNLF
ncbi:LytR/AlgR family response regulator transcription factor [Emticicia sp. SJ17W-69]|uniref:LytR/AlgR family response regulator transcription factor n=1 Tax=Emticicia sp. SJ17W-69 TaxID=3421657 RepID=UPI003EBCACB6